MCKIKLLTILFQNPSSNYPVNWVNTNIIHSICFLLMCSTCKVLLVQTSKYSVNLTTSTISFASLQSLRHVKIIRVLDLRIFFWFCEFSPCWLCTTHMLASFRDSTSSEASFGSHFQDIPSVWLHFILHSGLFFLIAFAAV